jgi:hypothetical protein
MMRDSRIIQAVVFLFLVRTAFGNDSAASTAMGGIRLRRESRVAMLKEKLTISTEKITVEYEFLNETDHDISTEVAFPIPAYAVTFSAGGIRDFKDFKVWVDGHEVKYRTFAKAIVGKLDRTQMLKRQGVDIASLGHFSDSGPQPVSDDFNKLPKTAQDSLVKAGLFNADEDHFPQWTVEKTYSWHQTFPAHKILHVRHQYRPGTGFSMVETSELDQVTRNKEIERIRTRKITDKEYYVELGGILDSVCLDPKLGKTLIDNGNKPTKSDQGYVHMQWVDYILTTANSWKTPIKEFELNVEDDRPVSFCWKGRVDQIDATHRRAIVKDFVPRKELHIAFFASQSTDE